MAPSAESVRTLLERSGIHLRTHQLAKLWEFHRLLRERNAADDLTRLVGFESIVVKHYVDSMIAGSLFHLPSPLLDLGTGAGFPGIPLKIRYPELELVLVESRERRVRFLEDVCARLELEGVRVVKLKAVRSNLRIPVSGVITRAVESVAATVQRAGRCLESGGTFLFLKGPSVGPEIAEAMARYGDKYELLRDEKYVLPGTPHRRRLVVLRKRPAPQRV
ncbi:MAG: 16S rRNA (guanine(527)-N(7))-methyltransferase RsmG [Candidatus Eiseniibacteriota bacterium]